MGRVYHDSMQIPRQAPGHEAAPGDGRVNQKRRTRAAIVAAAQDLLAQGVTPTVATAAELALVSRTTAYRYFPTQESLLVEIAMHADVDDCEDLVAQPVDAATAAARVRELLDRFNRHVHAEEAQYRTALRLYQDMWLEAAKAGDDTPVVREGRRKRWFETVLAPVRDQVGDVAFERLVAALGLLCGVEALVVLSDTMHLDTPTALALTDWAAGVLLEATLASP
jgi:AcrR family transcriptional regulator